MHFRFLFYLNIITRSDTRMETQDLPILLNQIGSFTWLKFAVSMNCIILGEC